MTQPDSFREEDLFENIAVATDVYATAVKAMRTAAPRAALDDVRTALDQANAAWSALRNARENHWRYTLERSGLPALNVASPRTAIVYSLTRQTEVSGVDSGKLKRLTPREIEVLRLIGEGKRTKEIAWKLGIAVKTATAHRANIMEKLEIHEAPSLVRFAIRTGICAA